MHSRGVSLEVQRSVSHETEHEAIVVDAMTTEHAAGLHRSEGRKHGWKVLDELTHGFFSCHPALQLSGTSVSRPSGIVEVRRLWL